MPERTKTVDVLDIHYGARDAFYQRRDDEMLEEVTVIVGVDLADYTIGIERNARGWELSCLTLEQETGSKNCVENSRRDNARFFMGQRSATGWKPVNTI